MRTDHSKDIARLRREAAFTAEGEEKLALLVAADLLELHDDTGISLDNWPAARQFVEHYIGGRIAENGV